MRPEIVILRHTPIDVDFEMYGRFAQLWESKVTVFADTSFSEERIRCGYRESSPYFETIFVDKNGINIEKYICEHKDAIFIIYGIDRAESLWDILNKNAICFGIISERDNSLVSKDLKTTVRRELAFLRRMRHRNVAQSAKFFWAMGQMGVDCFKKQYGIREQILYDFMYCDGNPYQGVRKYESGNPVRMVYIGRFDYLIKGVDILLDAIKNVTGKYELDLVGGYGNNREDVLERIKEMPNVKFLGAWPNQEIAKRLTAYDLIIVPSNLDGWNLHCNIAIKAGIGVISTDQAVSDELVTACKNGLVVPAGNRMEMKKAIQTVLDHPEILNRWKANTVPYEKRISDETVAQYLVDALDYSVLGIGKQKPKCPWVNAE